MTSSTGTTPGRSGHSSTKHGSDATVASSRSRKDKSSAMSSEKTKLSSNKDEGPRSEIDSRPGAQYLLASCFLYTLERSIARRRLACALCTTYAMESARTKAGTFAYHTSSRRAKGQSSIVPSAGEASITAFAAGCGGTSSYRSPKSTSASAMAWHLAMDSASGNLSLCLGSSQVPTDGRQCQVSAKQFRSLAIEGVAAV